jgi:hypothetical protein
MMLAANPKIAKCNQSMEKYLEMARTFFKLSILIKFKTGMNSEWPRGNKLIFVIKQDQICHNNNF